MKYQLSLLVGFALVSLWAFSGLFQSGFPHTHDGENHLARFANYKIAVREGQIPPRFAPNLMNRYGYPVFNYNYPLANIISLPFSVFKISYQTTFKIIVLIFLVLGAYGVYKYLTSINQIKTSTQAKLFASLVFLSSPFLVSTVIYRGNIGEIMAYCLFPWLLYSIERIRNGSKFSYREFVLITAIWSAFLLSHNISVLFGFALTSIYVLARFGKLFDPYKRLALPLLASFGLTLWFWLPTYVEMSAVIVSQATNQMEYLDHFPTLTQLLFSPLQFGYSYPGSIDSLSFSIGAIQILVIIFGFSLILSRLLARQSVPQAIIVSLGIALATLLFQLKITQPIWEIIPLANYIQFPWRLGLFFAVFSLPLIAYSMNKFPIKLSVLTWIALLFWLGHISNLHAVDRFDRTNHELDNFSQSTTTQNENLPINFTYSGFDQWQPAPEIISGSGLIKVSQWNGSKKVYDLSLDQESVVVEPTMYFPGWMTWVNGELISYLDNRVIGGRIAYKLPDGEYRIESRFTQRTPSRIVGNGISMLTLIALTGAGLRRFTSISP